MRDFLRRQLEQNAPALLSIIRALRNRRYFRRQFSASQEEFRKLLFPEDTAITVQGGPFAGLRYFDETVWGPITPKWLGSYEAELHPILQQVAKRTYRTIIDVGCAEGYYAVGLAVLVPSARVIAFDTDFLSRRQVQRLAKLNQVLERLTIGKLCSHSELDRLSAGGATLVVCDIEGFEAQLLDPALAASLLQSDILVEVHETSEVSAVVENLLRSRFAVSHEIQRIVATAREPWINEHGQRLSLQVPADLLLKATDERRATGRVWLWMQAPGAL